MGDSAISAPAPLFTFLLIEVRRRLAEELVHYSGIIVAIAQDR